MKATAVVGKNFGDEGKGLLVSALCRNAGRNLVVKHNGGAQAGHTVEDEKGEHRFVHHQIGAGAEYGADTLLSATFHPDLYQFGKEIESFYQMYGFIPVIYVEPDASITTIDDVLLNMTLEIARGSMRHGSCGMGINECCHRNRAGKGISVKDLQGMSPSGLFDELSHIREEYTLPRLKSLNIGETNPYHDMLHDNSILYGFSEEVIKNISFIKTVQVDKSFLNAYDSVVFEGGQGLLLDNDYEEYAPYLTPSKTGITNPVSFLRKRRVCLDEAIYVTRSYVTRHGNGPLFNECSKELIGTGIHDRTNKPNVWQGELRYAFHSEVGDFLRPIKLDTKGFQGDVSLCITHLNETDGKILTCQEKLHPAFFTKIKDIKALYCSYDYCNVEKQK